jgi:hypothetical protein
MWMNEREVRNQRLRERSWAAAAVLFAVVFGMGLRASIFYQADGERVRVVADHQPARRGDVSRLLSRVEQNTLCSEKIPGFTVIVGLSEYSVELSVPVAGMRPMLDDTNMKLAGHGSVCRHSVA